MNKKSMKISIKYLVLSIIGFAVWSLLAASPAYAGELSNQFTAELWVKPTNVVSRALMVKNNEIRLVTDASGKPLCQIYSSGAWQTAATSSVALTTNTWQHVACTYDRATLRVYVNGTQTGSQALTVALTDSATNFRIGSDEGGTYSDFSGVVDEHKVYNYPRTPAQILQDMQGTANAGVSGGSVLPDPIAHYSFDEQQGQSAHNKSIGGSSLDGTLGANSSASTDDPTWKTKADCKVNGCLGFDGGDYISAGDLSNFDFSNSDSKFSISAWVKPTTADTQQIVLSKHNPTNNQRGWAVGIETDNKMTIWLSEDGTYSDSTTVRYQTADTVPTSEFHHWTFTVDVSTDTFEIYKDGVLQSGAHANSKTTITDIYQNTSFVGIGILGNLISNFNGYIDEVKIYNTALTEDQVRQDMNSGSALAFGGVNGASEADDLIDGAGAPPVAYWSMDEKQGSSVGDKSGNGNIGTITGASWKSAAECKVGACLSFDGSGDQVQKTSFSGLPITNITVSGWINIRTLKNYNTVINHEWIASTGSWKMFVGSNGTIYFGVWDGADQNLASYSGLTANTWYYVTGVYDGSNVKVYVNGIKGTDNSLTSQALDSVGNVEISYSASDTFDGLIDEVKIYNYVRTPAQIAYDYNRGKPIAHWKFDECEGTTIHSSNQESVTSNLDGALTVTATGGNTNGVGTCSTANSAWGTGASGKFGASLNFDGDGDWVEVGNSNRTDVYAVSFWAKPADTTESFLQLSATDTVAVSSGTISIGGFGTETVYIDGKAQTSFPDSNWHHVTIVSTSAITANDIELGRVGATYYTGQIDDMQVYNYALSPAQVRKLYNGGAAVRFGE